jgi:hypothetical protein
MEDIVIEIKELTASNSDLSIKCDKSLTTDTKSSSSSDAIRRQITDNRKLVKKAIQKVLGMENEYLERLLNDKLEGKEKGYRRLQLAKYIRDRERAELRQRLAHLVEETQHVAVETLLEEDLLTMAQIEEGKKGKSGDSTAISSWVLHTLLAEKLKERELRDSADYWKYINGVGAVVLPIITCVIEYYVIKWISQGSDA